MDAYASVDNQTRRKMDEMLKTWKEPVPGSIDTRPVFPPDVVRPIENALIKARTTALQAQQESIRGQQALLSGRRQPPPPYRETPTPPGFRPGPQQPPPYGQQPPTGMNAHQQGPPVMQQAYPIHNHNNVRATLCFGQNSILTAYSDPPTSVSRPPNTTSYISRRQSISATSRPRSLRTPPTTLPTTTGCRIKHRQVE